MIVIRAGPKNHDEQRRENADGQREDHLDGGLCGGFLGPLLPFRPHGIRMNPERIGDGRPESFRLDQHGGEGP